MGKKLDPHDVALAVAELFGVALEVEEGSFVDPDGGEASVRISGASEEFGREWTIFENDLDEAVRTSVLVIASLHLADDEDDLGLPE